MTNYRRGYEIERKIVNMLRDEGYIAVRSAGSHSPIDVFGIKPDIIRLVQVKRVKTYREHMFDADIGELEALQAPPCCSKELWIWKDGFGWIMPKVIQ
jgi:Holliday junction resolvase